MPASRFDLSFLKKSGIGHCGRFTFGAAGTIGSASSSTAAWSNSRSASQLKPSSVVSRMERMLVLSAPEVNSFAGSGNSVPRKKVKPRCRLQALKPHTSLRPEKQSMFHLMDSVRSGSHVRIQSQSCCASGAEKSGHDSSHSEGSCVRAREQSIAD